VAHRASGGRWKTRGNAFLDYHVFDMRRAFRALQRRRVLSLYKEGIQVVPRAFVLMQEEGFFG